MKKDHTAKDLSPAGKITSSKLCWEHKKTPQRQHGPLGGSTSPLQPSSWQRLNPMKLAYEHTVCLTDLVSKPAILCACNYHYVTALFNLDLINCRRQWARKSV